ncbi:hypothetical protein, partial [Serratia marcescens]|uniref:hypothetical protein n=1 Tax=Serratia marcescens TaxID=615 RepID=UPI00195404E6
FGFPDKLGLSPRATADVARLPLASSPPSPDAAQLAQRASGTGPRHRYDRAGRNSVSVESHLRERKIMAHEREFYINGEWVK